MAGKIANISVPFIQRGTEVMQTFKIEFISNWAIKEYNQLASDGLKALKVGSKIKSGGLASITNISTEDSEVLEMARGLTDRQFDLIEYILDLNGLQFVRKAWERNTTPEAIGNFLRDAIKKDDSKKKAQAEA